MKINSGKIENHEYLFNLDQTKGIVINQPLPSWHRASHENKLTVPFTLELELSPPLKPRP